MGTVADAVVVGAGHNGLVAANLLADAGWDVVVLESCDEPGGSVRSTEFTPGYVGDDCSAFYPLALASPVLRRLELSRYGLAWRHAPRVLAHVLPDGRAAVLSRDPERTAASLETFAAGDGQRWLRAYRYWRGLSADLLAALFTPLPSIGPAARLLRHTGTAAALRLARGALLPARGLGDELFDGPGGPLLLAGCALHTDLGPDEPGSAAYGWLLAMLGQQFGFPVPAGGAGRLTGALVTRLAAAGGTVRCGNPVARIEVAGGRARAVVTADGARVLARRAVIADVSAPALYGGLLADAHLPARLRADLRRFRWDHATLKVDWALRQPPAWIAPDARGAGTLHLAADMAGLSRYAADLSSGRTPRSPFLVLGQMTTADPDRSPAGTESVWAYTHLPHGWSATPRALAAHVDRMERTIERYAPGFTASVVARRVAGPDELQRHNPSLVHGALNGGSARIAQQLALRPVPGLGRADTPVDRLYLASSSAHPGGGVHGGPGANAARAALHRDRPLTGAAYAAAVRAAHRIVY